MAGPLTRNTPLEGPDGSALSMVADGHYAATLTGNLTLDYSYPNHLALDPGGSNRDVTLPAVATSEGLWYHIANKADNAENLVIKNAVGSTIATANQNEMAIVYCDAGAWALFAIVSIAIS